MRSDQYGQIIYNEQDLCNLVMLGRDITCFDTVLTDNVDLTAAAEWLVAVPCIKPYQDATMSVIEFDQQQQQQWHMPDQYRDYDIAEYVLSLCSTSQELQRCGEELLLYQERGLFDLLRYLRYLVDVMRDNNVIWGVGRGSSVSSYVLYLMGVHRINSLYYDLDIAEFLR